MHLFNIYLPPRIFFPAAWGNMIELIQSMGFKTLKGISDRQELFGVVQKIADPLTIKAS